MSSLILNQPVESEESFPVDAFVTSTLTKMKSSGIVSSIRKFAAWHVRSITMRIVVFAASLISCALFIIDTYDKMNSITSNTIMAIIDLVVFAIFALDYLCNVIYAPRTLSYIFSFQGFIDLASLASIINIFTTGSADLSFLPLLRLLRNFKLLRTFQLSAYIDIDNPQPLSAAQSLFIETCSLGVAIVVSWFFSASVLYSIVQQDSDAFVYNSDSSFDMQKDLTLFDCIYILLVLISTLGFGDFSPNNFYGRLFVMVVMVLTLTVIPAKVGALVERLGKKSLYMNSVRAPCVLSSKL